MKRLMASGVIHRGTLAIQWESLNQRIHLMLVSQNQEMVTRLDHPFPLNLLLETVKEAKRLSQSQ